MDKVLKISAILLFMVFYSSQSFSAGAAKNLKCKGCVGTKDLAKNAVTSSKIRDGSVKVNDLSLELQGEISALGTNLDEKQDRVTGVCPPGQSIGAINADGTVICEVGTGTDTNAATLCPDNTLLNGDGNCDTIPINYPAVSYSGRLNTSPSPVFFDEANHQLIVNYVAPNNDFIINSTTTDPKQVVIDDGTGATVSGIINTVAATLSKNVLDSRIATIDLLEISSDKIYRYRCMASTNLVSCTQEIY